jgi:hypothetical protein
VWTRNIKVTPKQIRFLLEGGRVWMIQPLHVPEGIPQELCGYYSVSLEEERKHGWGLLTGQCELEILREWLENGFKV